MPLIVHTAGVSYSGPDRLDITRRSAGPDGLPFAPSCQILGPALHQWSAGELKAAWPGYAASYTAEMCTSYREHRQAWDALLACPEVTLCCYCTDPAHCHRTVLAEILRKLGAEVRGERVAERAQAELAINAGGRR